LKFVRRYLAPRLVQYVLVIFLGITVIFIIPRLMPGGPVESAIANLQARGSYLDPKAMEATAHALRQMYGLEGTWPEQYVAFWRRLFTGDFGPSLYQFPTPVIQLIGQALPWTFGLLLVTTTLSWIVGTVTGGLAGYFPQSRTFGLVDAAAMFVRPIPYYVLAMVLLILFAYLIPVFPVGRGYTIGAEISLNWSFVSDVLRSAFLPALSLMLIGAAVSHQTMRLVVEGVKEEDYVRYAKIGAVKESTIFSRYVMRNAILPLITSLALSIGQIFGGALITEMVFSYPGVGFLLFRAVVVNDYNLIMGITTISIIAIVTATLILDLVYPLFDPRIRLK
jgi:peptide/nickel transport system permease protein